MCPLTRKIVLPEAKAGDIVGFSGRSWISAAVNVATYGIPLYGLSHVGVLANSPDGKLRLFESTSLDGDSPCEILGKSVCGTQAHSLDAVLKRYRGKAWLYPLYRSLYPAEDQRLTEFLMGTLGRPYDALGALRSAGIGLSWAESLLHPASLHMIFCSEQVAAAYADIGLHATDNVSRWSPNRLCRHLRRYEILLKPRRIL